jgi:hypothetical protein
MYAASATCLRSYVDTDRGSSNCKGVDTGSDSHWTTDANDFAEWGVGALPH